MEGAHESVRVAARGPAGGPVPYWHLFGYLDRPCVRTHVETLIIHPDGRMDGDELSLMEIASADEMLPIEEVAGTIGVTPDEIENYGRHMAKLKLQLLERLGDSEPGRLVLITAMTPTRAGEGKTTVSIGLSEALNRLGQSSVVVLREPSLGPMFGVKGAGTGGGRARVVPTLDINLHFTGDLYAVAAANNLVAAVLDNHIFRGNALLIDQNKVVWRRCLDVNDRGLRNVVTGVGPESGVARTDSFTISAASEVMAILGLTTDLKDLEERLGAAVVAYNYSGEPVRVSDLNVQGAMTLLLKDAIRPNLVQTTENTPAIVHGGPFANIAHGTASLMAIQMALRLTGYAVVEAGFGSELGAEKFFNIVARAGGFDVSAGVVVASVRALRRQGGAKLSELNSPSTERVASGLPNLKKHIENVTTHGVPAVVALNVFGGETGDEIDLVRALAAEMDVPFAVVTAFENGGEGATDLAEAVVEACESGSDLRFLYETSLSVEDKIRRIAGAMYGMDHVVISKAARERIELFEAAGFVDLPICMAKTPLSISNDPKVRGIPPRDMPCTIQGLKVNAGAGFLVAFTENVNLMPGLPAHPIAEDIDIGPDGEITGVR